LVRDTRASSQGQVFYTSIAASTATSGKSAYTSAGEANAARTTSADNFDDVV
jgi:hypothetical protein